MHARVGIGGMPRNLVGRIQEAAGIAEPPLRGHPWGVTSGRSSKAGHVRDAAERIWGGSSKPWRGSPVAAASVSFWGIALHIHGTPRGRSADLRRTLSTTKENAHGTDNNNDNNDDSTNTNSSKPQSLRDADYDNDASINKATTTS